jgi:hypothetical protein
VPRPEWVSVGPLNQALSLANPRIRHNQWREFDCSWLVTVLIDGRPPAPALSLARMEHHGGGVVFFALLPRLLLISHMARGHGTYPTRWRWPTPVSGTFDQGVPESESLKKIFPRVTWLDVKRDELLWLLIASPSCVFFCLLVPLEFQRISRLDFSAYHHAAARVVVDHRTARQRFGCATAIFHALPSVINVIVSLGYVELSDFTLGILATDMTFYF